MRADFERTQAQAALAESLGAILAGSVARG
jgi:hypothetical protein